MSNEVARLARQWADTRNPDTLTEVARAAREHILATTTPLTMADVEWNDEKHYLAGATNSIGDKECVMIAEAEGMIVNAELGDDCVVLTSLGALTPNGKRYELREIGAPEQPAHPETLVTKQDYEKAPEGTVVAEPDCTSWTKCADGDWWRGGIWYSDYRMAGTERQELRRGVGQVTTNITPDKARKLLDGTTPGPWVRHPDQPRALCNLDTRFLVHHEMVTNRGMEPSAEDVANTELIAAAPALAHLAANLHYEYAVQNAETGKWVRECGGVLIYTSSPSAADWNTDLEETQNFEEWITDETLIAHRVVRRLVSDPEVVE